MSVVLRAVLACVVWGSLTTLASATPLPAGTSDRMVIKVGNTTVFDETASETGGLEDIVDSSPGVGCTPGWGDWPVPAVFPRCAGASRRRQDDRSWRFTPRAFSRASSR
jgi:hypothetical protein